jgi:hypothetical protein
MKPEAYKGASGGPRGRQGVQEMPAVRTWVPRGHAPGPRLKVTGDRRAVLNGTSVPGRLVLQIHAEDTLAKTVVGCLRVLLRMWRA